MLHCKTRLQVAIVLLLLHLQPALLTPYASPVRPNALHSIYESVNLGGRSLGLTVLRVFKLPLAPALCLDNTM
jgi:hypothetical protein